MPEVFKKYKIGDSVLSFRRPSPDEYEECQNEAAAGKAATALRMLAESCAIDKTAFREARKAYPAAAMKVGRMITEQLNEAEAEEIPLSEG